jgi:hypothetical protein
MIDVRFVRLPSDRRPSNSAESPQMISRIEGFIGIHALK